MQSMVEIQVKSCMQLHGAPEAEPSDMWSRQGVS